MMNYLFLCLVKSVLYGGGGLYRSSSHSPSVYCSMYNSKTIDTTPRTTVCTILTLTLSQRTAKFELFGHYYFLFCFNIKENRIYIRVEF